MPKSKYPQQLDTSAEVPPVRDNILEVGSDVINSLRSAIFNIERTLGINPQGAVGRTLAERIDRSLDGNGNIRPDALSQANILSGPILDKDVSTVAAIKESKLKLNYPTALLQSEILVLNNTIDSLLNQVQELTVELSAHINPNSLNRHAAVSISIEGRNPLPNNVAAFEIPNGSVQNVVENIYDAHINFSGSGISDSNNSHEASQIFFDNSEVSSLIPGDDVQEAIENVALASLRTQVDHQSLMHSNGILRVGEIDTAINQGTGVVLADGVSVSFSITTGSNNLSIITLNDLVELGDFDLKKSDIVNISDESNPNASYIGNHEIESFTLSGPNIGTITVFGSFSEDGTSETTIKISKNTQVAINSGSLLSAAREEADLTASRTIQICNPNSCQVVSSGIRPYEITTSNRFLGIAVNSGTASVLDLFDGTVSRQSVDSVVSKINEQCAENSYNFLAYRLDKEGSNSEVVIAHNLPDESDDSFTLTISRESDGGIDAAGFTHIEDQTISTKFGSSYYIDGISYEGLSVKIDSTDLSYLSSSILINSGASGLDFVAEGIKIRDVLIISGSDNPSDDGSYVILGVSSNQLTLSLGQLPSGFSSTSSSGVRFRVINNIASFDSITFDEVGSTFGSILADVFLNKDRDVGIDKRFEYVAELFGGEALFNLIDFEGEVGGKEFIITISDGSDHVKMSLDGGDVLEIRGDHNYIWLDSGSSNVKLKFYVSSIAALQSQLASLGSDIVKSLFGFDGVNGDSNLKISRVAFNNFNGRFTGGQGSPRALSILNRGNIGLNEISSDFKKQYIQRATYELRSNGVVSGLEIVNATLTGNLFSFELKPGYCYVNGRRIEVDSKTNYITDIDATSVDKIFISIDESGTLIVEGALGASCSISFENSMYAVIGSLEYDGVNVEYIDLRLFINDLDLKILNAITVSPEPGMGHFTDLGKALKYAKRFTQMFPLAGTPTVHMKSGDYELTNEFDNSSITFSAWQALGANVLATELADGLIRAGLAIDFPVSLTGEGDSTRLILRNRYTYSDQTYTYKGMLFIPGDGYSDHTIPLDKITDGFLNISNFKMDNCKIFLTDMNVVDIDGPLNFGITLENITFDHREFATPNPVDNIAKFRSVLIDQVTDLSTEKGNVSVKDCNFILDESDTNGWVVQVPGSLSKGMTFSNNKIYNGDSDTSFFSNDIVSFANADNGANIYIYGNMPITNFDTAAANRPKIAQGLDFWADRFSRGVYVGGDGSFGGAGSFGGPLEADEYTYANTKILRRTLTFENFSDVSLTGSSFEAELYRANILGQPWKTISFPDGAANSLFYTIRIPLNEGETLTSLGVQYYEQTISSFGRYEIEITEIDENSNGSVVLPYTDSGPGVPQGGGVGRAAIGTFSVTGQVDHTYWVRLRRSNNTGFDNEVFSLRLVYAIDSIEAAIGAA